MATRFYLPSSGAVNVSPVISGSDWSHINVTRRPLNSINGGSVISTLNYAPDVADHLVSGISHLIQFVSDILPPQVIISQIIKLQLRALEANANNNLVINWKLYSVSEDGGTVLGNLVSLRADGLEAGTVLTNRGDSVSSVLFTATTNFRLVLEIGLGGLPIATSGVQGHNGSLSFGENGISDLPEDDVATGALNPWLQFSQNIQFKTGGSNLTLTLVNVCSGGNHLQISAKVNNGEVRVFDYTVDELMDPLPEETIKNTVLGILKLYSGGKTGTELKSFLQSGIILSI